MTRIDWPGAFRSQPGDVGSASKAGIRMAAELSNAKLAEASRREIRNWLYVYIAAGINFAGAPMVVRFIGLNNHRARSDLYISAVLSGAYKKDSNSKIGLSNAFHQEVPDHLNNYPNWASKCAAATKDWRNLDLVFP